MAHNKEPTQLDLPFDAPYMSALEAEAWWKYVDDHGIVPGESWATLDEEVKAAYLECVIGSIIGD